MMDLGGVWFLVWFNLFILAMLALDLGVFHRKAHEVSTREAAIWSLVWIGLALSFNVLLYFWQGGTVALEFLTGYIIEKTLSVDNVFVFILIFSYFNVPAAYQHRVLFWGIVGALIMRGVFIATGAVLLAKFDWVMYIFGIFLVLTAMKMAMPHREDVSPENNPLVRLACRVLPVTERYEGERFFVRRGTKLLATPLFLVLIMVESTDLVFALDSIPAIFGVTRDPLIVYSSNVFAILGLRALYFLLAGVLKHFCYLKQGLAVILMFIGVKMLLHNIYYLPVSVSLAVVFGVLAVSILASLAKSAGDRRRERERKA